MTNYSGERTDVILSLGDYESLMEDLSDLASIADRRGEPTIPHEEFLAQLKAGAGVVADSDPTYGYNETVTKSKALIRAIALAKTIKA